MYIQLAEFIDSYFVEYINNYFVEYINNSLNQNNYFVEQIKLFRSIFATFDQPYLIIHVSFSMT